MKRLFLYFFFVLLLKECFGDCQVDCQSGYCDKGKCNCFILHEGENCQIPWKLDVPWANTFVTLATILGVFHLTLGVISSYNLHKIRKLTKNRFFSLSMAILGGFSVALYMRAIFLIIDPWRIRDLLPRPLLNLLFTLPLVIWASLNFLIILYWASVIQFTKKLREREFVTQKMKRGFVILSIVCAIIIVPVALVRAFIPIRVVFTILNLLAVIFLILMIVFSIFYGIKLYKILKTMEVFSSEIKRLNQFFISTVLIFTVAAVLVGIEEASGVDSSKWAFLAFNLFYRLLEGGYVICVLFLIAHPVEEEVSSSSIKTVSQSKVRSEATS